MLHLTTQGMAATITNSRLAIVFSEAGFVDSLKLDGQELLDHLTGEPRDPDKSHSFYLDYHMAGKTVNMRPTTMTVVTNTDQQVHLAYTDDQQQLGLRYHFVVFDNDPALYGYVEAWSNSDETFEVNELRTVYRLDHQLFNIGYNAERTGHQPTSAHMMTGKKLQDETYDMADGSLYSNSSIYSKYDYAGYTSENALWGQYGAQYGLWFIPTDRSYFPSGPLNQDLLLHYDGLILNYLTGSHFGTGDMRITPGWHKFYGPWCVLLTQGDDQLATAKARVQKEHAAWPYRWCADDNYPLQLSTVSGTVTMPGDSDKTPWTIVLAQPDPDGTFMHQQGGYIYSATTDEAGRFTLQSVRPGAYTIYAYAQGGRFVGMQHQDNIQVQDAKVTLPLWTLEAPTRQLVWQIGQSTHTTAGFKFSDQLRNHIWKDLVPANLTYHIGESGDEWYYLQNDQGRWQIIFTNDGTLSQAPLHLTLAFAGVTKKVMTEPRGTGVAVKLNDQVIAERYFPRNDSAGYRSSLRGGNYATLEVELPAATLQEGANCISISTDGYLLYDTILLEQGK